MLNTVALDGVAFHHCLAAHSHFLDNNTQLIVHNDGPPPSHFCWRRISGNDLLHYFYYASLPRNPGASDFSYPFYCWTGCCPGGSCCCFLRCSVLLSGARWVDARGCWDA